ncbi:MAG: M14 family zinc carboxypeptidase [Lachnospiraceae bacterium]
MRNIYLGDRGVLVQYLQLALTRAGYPVELDGIFGTDTCKALREFRREYAMHGETVGCYVDQSVWKQLIPYLKGYVTHVIVKGDTIWNIAGAYGTTQEAVLRANPSIQVNALQPGMRIYVPLAFPLVSEEVAYTSILLAFIIEGLRIRYPFLTIGNIGTSVMEKEIPYIRIGTGATEVFYNASFHANEWITTPLLLKFAEEYASAYAQNGIINGEIASSLYDTYSLYLVPMVNPDGVDLVNGVLGNARYEQQAKIIAAQYPDIPYPDGWKANIDGVDLNLQFPAGWEQARTIKFSQGYTTPAPRDYVGEAPLTAVESINVYEFTRMHDFRLIIAYHTQGEVIYWKYMDYEPDTCPDR